MYSSFNYDYFFIVATVSCSPHFNVLVCQFLGVIVADLKNKKGSRLTFLNQSMRLPVPWDYPRDMIFYIIIETS